jgi:autophagy-related protein 18
MLRFAAGARGAHSLAFDADGAAVVVTSRAGLRVVELGPPGPARGRVAAAVDAPGVDASAHKAGTSLVAFSGPEPPAASLRKLTLFNASTGTVIKHLGPFTGGGAVLSVLFGRHHLAVVLERSVHLYVLATLEAFAVVETVLNPKGLAALAPGAALRLAVPAAGPGGAVAVHELGGGAASSSVVEIAAHRAPLAALAWSADGALLATASAKGTRVLVHSPAGARTRAFRRGVTPARVTSLAWSPAGIAPAFLAAASAHGTLHLFSLGPRAGGLPATLAALVPALAAAAAKPAVTVRLGCRRGAAVALACAAAGGGAARVEVVCDGTVRAYIARCGAGGAIEVEAEGEPVVL